jgi:hypothetical protein
MHGLTNLKFFKTVKDTRNANMHRMHMTAPFKPTHFLPFSSCLYLWRREIANIKIGFLSLSWKSVWNSVYYTYHGIYRDCIFFFLFILWLSLFFCFLSVSFFPVSCPLLQLSPKTNLIFLTWYERCWQKI